ncbi:RNA polymerase subunit sigma-70 [Nocardioides speluncae]|uniref:RNA polymerase subunit sigma-70 n=1 Tax=Nocardioides speluncae TaxID=2670337 RepID=UPI000D69E44E|nr:RNA polymerase subunit sigma-70 [Nocardioides speluncae]
MDESQLLDRARGGDEDAFAALVAPYRSELHAHCYRMLGSVHDADDALQEALIGAWKGLAGFEGRSSLRGWLYTIATHAAMRLGRNRPKRVLSIDYGPATVDPHQLGDMVDEPVWLEPYPTSMLGTGPADPAARYDARESVEIAFVAALQHLPATQRAVLILREVLAFSAAEVAAALETTVAAVNSALQRARAGLDARLHRAGPQQDTINALGDERVQKLLDSLVTAWERADVPAIMDLLVSDAVLSMPPLPAWFRGREAVARFMRERMFVVPWRARVTSVNGQLALACYQADDASGASYHLGGIVALTLDGDRIAALTSFLAPMIDERYGVELSWTEPMSS